ncbi:MAG: threonine synthase, partial [Flavobacteriales bacterium]|nr:threonine synthase [Flavobacteriales bacterium]
HDNPVVAVPSGNFGNLAAGMLMKKMGLPIGKFIAATNNNSVVPEFLEGKNYEPRSSVATISNAMDVGSPSNFVRMLELAGSQEALREQLLGISFTDDETKNLMREAYSNYKYICDPHGAIGYGALKQMLNKSEKGIFLETAHPAKFHDIVEPTLNTKVQIPEGLADCLKKKKESIILPATEEALKDYLMA